MILKRFLIFFFFQFTFSLFCQEINKGPVYDYARKIVDTMASRNMHGRGYVNGGDSIAAFYLKSEFQKDGLKNFNNDYYQKFSFPINTFPEDISFGFDLGAGSDYFQFKGIAGKNFLIDAGSNSILTDFSIEIFDSTNAKSEKAFRKFSKKILKTQFILVDDRNVTDKNKIAYFKRVKNNELKAAGIIEIVNKLTWHQSQSVLSYSKIQILADSFKYKESKRPSGGGGIEVHNKFIPEHPAQNVIGYVEGSVYPDSFIVFSAHYDHLGHLGKEVYFPGANDNASGCAMLLNLARYYSNPKNKPRYSVVFIAFAGEEVGLLGSEFFTKHPSFPMKNIKFLLNMDIMGTGEDGITVVNGTLFKNEFEKLKQLNKEYDLIREVKVRGKAANSDHYYFSENGVKAFFIYTMGGIKAYHDIYDRPETLPLNEFEDLFKLIIKFGDYLQN
jgi:aminopeptidase YwaD